MPFSVFLMDNTSEFPSSHASTAPHPNQTTADCPRNVIVPTTPKLESSPFATALAGEDGGEWRDSGTQKGIIWTLSSIGDAII